MRRIVLRSPELRERAANEVRAQPTDPDHPLVVEIKPMTRSLEQNSLLWSLLGEVSHQVEWHGQRLSPSEWKDMMTAALKRQRVVPGIDGGFVVLGSSTSKMSKAEMSELIEFIFAFGAERGIEFRDEEGLRA